MCPGLSTVLLKLIDFDGCAIRCRPAHELHAGKEGLIGGLIGMTVAEATCEHGWLNATFIGLESGTHQGSEVVFGIAPSPEHVISELDVVLFVCETSMPIVSKRTEDHADYFAKARKLQLLDDAESGIQRSDSSLSERGRVMLTKSPFKTYHHKILVCGWRTDWNEDQHPER